MYSRLDRVNLLLDFVKSQCSITPSVFTKDGVWAIRLWHFEVLGKDASGLQAFYREAFGWQMEPAVSAPLYRAIALGGRQVLGPVDAPGGPRAGVGRATRVVAGRPPKP